MHQRQSITIHTSDPFIRGGRRHNDHISPQNFQIKTQEMAESNITRQIKAMRLLGSAQQTQCSCAVGLE